jgi:ABC-type polysaccharide/polyol phosphate transport system ATPase subunit
MVKLVRRSNLCSAGIGAGFDPEFTGVENVYMNASLLGFRA